MVEAYILFSVAAGLQNESAFIAAQSIAMHLEPTALAKADEQIATELQALGIALDTLHAAPTEPILDPMLESSSSSSVSSEIVSSESVSSAAPEPTVSSSSVAVAPIASSSSVEQLVESTPVESASSSTEAIQGETVESVSSASSAVSETIRFNKRRIRDLSNTNNIQ